MPNRAGGVHHPPLSHSSSYAAASRRREAQQRSGGIAAFIKRQTVNSRGVSGPISPSVEPGSYLEHYDRGVDSDNDSGQGDESEGTDEHRHADSEEEEHQWLEDEEQLQTQHSTSQLEENYRPLSHLRLLGTGSSSRVPALPHRPDKAYDVEVHSENGESDAESLQNQNMPPIAPSSDSSSSMPDEQDDADRIAWQDMLSNVLQGDVLKSEKDRLAGSLAHQLDDSAGRAKYQANQIWTGVRAAVRQRSIEAEHRFLNEAKSQIPAILNEVIGFKVPKGATLQQASGQITALLNRVDWVSSLFPSFKALRSSEPSFDADAMLDRINTLQSWITITTRLHLQLNILQRWTGSDSLEVTQPKNEIINSLPKGSSDPNTPLLNSPAGSDDALPNEGTKSEKSARILDTSNFIERMLKQESLSSLFQKRIINDIFPLLENAKDTAIACHERFKSMGLPSFDDEFVVLLSFPMRLMREALRLRLDSGSRINKDDPNLVLIDQLADDFRAGLELATNMKNAYLSIVSEQFGENWVLPQVQDDALDSYDGVLSEALKFFFRLLHWKLKSGNRSIYLKETEIVEAEWEFLSRSVEQIDGGDLLVAEHFSCDGYFRESFRG